MNALIHFLAANWVLIAVFLFLFGGGIADGARRALRTRHKRRLAVIEAKQKSRKPLPGAGTAPGRADDGPQPVCGCAHHLALHNPQTGKCHGIVKMPRPGMSRTAREMMPDVAYRDDDCRCQQYVGPEPLGRVVAMPIVDLDALG